MSRLTIQPIGHTLKERTTNGIRAYAIWDAMEELSESQRELVLKSVECLKDVTVCSWYLDQASGSYRLLLERGIDLKWAGDQGVARDVRTAIEEACGTEFALQVGVSALG